MNNVENPRLRPVEINAVEQNGERLFVIQDQQQLSDESIVLTPTGVWILQNMTGENSLDEIREQFQTETGEEIPPGMLEELIDSLDEHYLLENDRSHQRMQEVIDNFKQKEVREPTLTNQAIPEESEELDDFFRELLPEYDQDVGFPDFNGLIVPHIDYFRGKQTYSSTVSYFRNMPDVDRVIMLGISHYACPVPFSTTTKTFKTPHGLVEVDEPGLNALTDNLPYDSSDGEIAHRLEHSIEIPLILLQHARPDLDFSIIPIICSYREESDVNEHLETLLPEIEQLLDDDTVLVAGVDFAHMGPQFGDREPLSESDYERIENRDREMIESIVEADAGQFESHIQSDNNRRRVCGYPALRTLLPLFDEGHLIEYDQWQDPNETVTYGALALR